MELLAKPNLLFLDEPTSGLDPGLDKRLMYLMRRLADHAEKLNAQLKDGQRKNEQLNDMLEALKAIERGLPVRPSSGQSGGVK